MSPKRIREIEALYQAVRKASAEERAALLARSDPELRREVELLLSEATGDLSGDTTVAQTTVGASLGPYRIESKLGAGGMGEVFRAVDTRLGRSVAIKTVHEQFSARFEREARAIASLNHPHICTLHDIGPNYLVMELVEGETIEARLKSGRLPVKTALLYASQIAAALVEAHGQGIVHRDLKPGNLMIAKSGVKVLDFGLARSSQDETLTGTRMVVGTPAYMAPEQRQGKPADARSDVYSFGCVLHEMFAGVRVGSAGGRFPSRKLEAIVRRCLEEDPERRWQSAVELERELAGVSSRTFGWRYLAAATVLPALSGGAYFYLHRAPKLTDKDTLVLADFENKTNDPVFDDTLRRGLAIELEQSPFLSLITDLQVQRMLALMGQPKDARLTPEIARQICERTGSAAVLEGSIASLGSRYVVGLQATNCTTGRILDQQQGQATSKEEVLNTLSQIARAFRTRVGESLVTIEKHSAPLPETSTSSPEALKAYSTAMKVLLTSGNTASIPYFQRAVEIDPKFTMVYAHLGLHYSALGESALAVEYATKAWKLRDRVSDRERFYVDFIYYRNATGNLEKAYETLHLWAEAYPRPAENPSAQSLMVGLSAAGTGHFEAAVQAAQTAMAQNFGGVFAYSGLAGNSYHLDRFSDTEDALRRASERKLAVPVFTILQYNLAFLKGDREQMERTAALAKGKREVGHWITHSQALVLARSGQLQQAREMTREAVALARQEEEKEEAATYQAAAAVWEALSGNAMEAKANAAAALAVSNGRDVEYAAALALGLAGESSRSVRLADDLDQRFPEDTMAQFTYVPVLRGLSMLRSGRSSGALESLQTALKYELAANGLNFKHLLGGLHSAYLRGETLVALRRYTEAAVEYQKILDHRGLVGTDPIGALAHLQLGRTFALAGDPAKAKAAYETFLALWKDADPDVPILLKAKAEYARLAQ